MLGGISSSGSEHGEKLGASGKPKSETFIAACKNFQSVIFTTHIDTIERQLAIDDAAAKDCRMSHYEYS
jgi:hypothetical protein